MPIVDKEGWENVVQINEDPYGEATVDTAREAMRLLDTPEYQTFDCHKLICKADKNDDLTGFMAGCIAQMISKYHSRGNEFRKKWNMDYGVKEDEAKGGVVNPALVTIETK